MTTTNDSTRAPLAERDACEVLVIGGGPSGAAAAYWLASAGVDVVMLERKHYPREKTCGDGLTPRSVRQLYDMGLAPELAAHHRFEGLRAHAFGRELILRWPEHPDYPSHGYVVTRADLDEFVARRAEKAGARVYEGAEALEPLGGVGGPALGARVTDKDHGSTSEIRARYVLVADGANSRVGRALGAQRDRSVPQGMALRGYYSSPRHDEPYIESHLDIRDRSGSIVPGYGWIFPLGDGRVNVGIGMLSSFDRWKDVNTSRLFEAFVDYAPKSWCLSERSSLGAPTGGRLPMGLSVGPRVGPDYLLCGDAAGSINPFNGEGIAYGYETGRIAARHLVGALQANDPGLLNDYAAELETTYGLYYKVASAFVRLIGRPELLRVAVGTGMYSRTLMEWVLRVMSNLLRPDEIAPAELAYRSLARLVERRS